jgi:hypothetical protein
MIIETKRAGILLAIIFTGLSLVFILPKGLSHQPLGVVEMTDMPEYVGAWRGADLPITDNERTTLGKDTGFARKSYTTLGSFRGKKGTLAAGQTGITLSVVLSGQDMNTSIHMAERCLPTQGWNIADKREVPFNLPGTGSFSTTRLYNTRIIKNKETEKLEQARMLNYYWFVGHTITTGSHFERTVIDMKDRLLSGYNQRWAYITVTAYIPSVAPAKQAEADAVVDEMIREFIVTFMPKAMKDTVKLN